MKKRITRLVFLSLFTFIVASCNQNPFFGIGNEPDTTAPKITISSHQNLDFVAAKFILAGSCSDNIEVTGVTVKEVNTAKQWNAVVNNDRWTTEIYMENDGEYLFDAYVYDAAGNSSNESYKRIPLIVDSKKPISSITEPVLSELDFLKEIDNKNFDYIDLFHNETFNIKGNIDENFKIKSVALSLIDLSGDNKFTKTIVNGQNLPEGVTGSVWNWNFNIKCSELIENGLKIDEKKKYYYLVKVTTIDMATNEDDDFHGYVCVYGDSDKPWSKFASIKNEDVISTGSLISGNSYDDDGVSKIYIKIVEKNIDILAEEYKSWKETLEEKISVKIIDKSLDNPRIFTWSVQTPSAPGTYSIYIKTEDMNGKTNEGYDKIDFIIPDINTPFTSITSHSNQNVVFGDFKIIGYSYDNIEVKKVKIAWLPEDKDSLLLNNSSYWEHTSDAWFKDGMKFYDITSLLSENIWDETILSVGRWKKNWEKSFSESDFKIDNKIVYSDKNFVIYTEDNAKNISLSRLSLLKERESPAVTILTPQTNGEYKKSDENNYFVISGTWSDNSEKIKKIEVKWIEGDESKDAVISGNNWSINSNEFQLTAGSQNFEIKACDYFDNNGYGRVFVIIDNDTPLITAVSSTKDGGVYKAGTSIPVTVQFNKNVYVKGTPRLKLNSAETAFANYISGNGTTTLTFGYAIKEGENTLDLDYYDVSALSLNEGEIKDIAGNNASLSLAAPGNEGSLGKNKNISIDTLNPYVIEATSTTTNIATNDNYNEGSVLTLTLRFNETLIVTGKPLLKLNVTTDNSEIRYAEYAFGSTTDTLVFNYKVSAGDNSPKLDYFDASSLLLPNGVNIADIAGNTASTSLKTPGQSGSISANRNIVIDTNKPNPPTINEISKQQFSITASEGKAQYSIDNGAYTDYSSAVTIPLKDSTTISAKQRDNAGNWSDVSIKTITADVTMPAIISVTSPESNGYYNAGREINVAVQFTRNVLVTGTPKLKLNSGSNVYASYLSGSDSSLLTFRYTVLSGEESLNLDCFDKNSLTLNGGTIKDSLGRDAALELPNPGDMKSLGYNKNIVIDTNSPAVTNVSSTYPNTYYKSGDIIPITVDFNEVVFVTGTPQILLETGSSDTYANYVSGGGTSSLIFNYTVQNGNTSLDLDYVNSSSLIFNSGTIKDAALNNATLTLPASGASHSLGFNKNISVDTTAASVLNISSSTSDGFFNENKVIALTTVFSEIVYVTGSPRLKLNSAAGRYAVYAFGSGTDTLTFSYTVLSGDNVLDLDYDSTNALELNSGSIKDIAGNDASLTLFTPGSSNSLGANKNLTVDTSSPLSPSINGITAGIYNTDKTFTITGESNAIIQYSFDNGINWINYSDEVTISSTGTYYIVAKQKDKAGNESTFTATLNVVLDKINPQVSNITAIQPNGEYKEGNSIEIKVDFTKAVNVTGAPRLILNTTPTKYAVYQSGSGTSSLSFIYSVSVNDISSRLDYLAINSLELNGGTIKDTVDTGNAASITLAVPGEQKSLGYNKNIKIDGVTPVISSFSPSNLAKNVDKSSNLTITFSEPVYKESGTIDIVRKYKRFPIIVSIDDYNEYKSRLSGAELTKFIDSYTLTTNGASAGTVSNVAVYVLKYTLDADDADLLSIFDAIGYNKISIDIQSTQVTGSGTDTITINPFDNLPVGVDFYVNISSTAFRDGVGHYFSGILDSISQTFVTGPVASPIIRINKTSGSGTVQPFQTSFKIDCETEGATIRYTSTNTSPSVSNPSIPVEPSDPTGSSTQFVAETTIGTTSSTLGHIERIKARGFHSDLSQSAVSEEIAFKTVLATKNAAGSGKFIWYRGSNNSGGPTTAPGFPLRWEDNQYLYIKCAAWETGDRWYWISWEINVNLEYKSLWADRPADWESKGPSVYSWESGSNNGVSPGGYRWEEVKSTWTSGYDNYENWGAHTRP